MPIKSSTTLSYLKGLKDYLFHTTNSFTLSDYRPTIGEDKSVNYYTRDGLKNEVALNLFGGTDSDLKTPIGDNNYFYKDFNDAHTQLSSRSKNWEHRNTSNGTLGNYNISAGEDDRGRYISFVDKFDHVIIPGKPIHIYDRIYEDEVNNLYDPSKSAVNVGDFISRSPTLKRLKRR